jgi:hypothetical protein
MRLALALTAAVIAVAAASARAETADEDLVPGGTALSTIFPASEVETWRVAAPAGSTLSVDLRPLRRGFFAPALEATLSDGSGAAIPVPSKSGRTRSVLHFPDDGVLELRVLSGRGGAGHYRLRTRLRPAKGPDFTGSVEGAGGTVLEFAAPAGATGTVRVKAAAGGSLVPRILSLEAPGGPASGEGSPGPTSDLWKKVPLPEAGPWSLTVGGADGSTGPFSASVRWRSPRGPSLDLRDLLDPSALQGTYAALLAPVPSGPVPLPFLTGGIEFDGSGRLATDLASLAPTLDAAAPLGIALVRTPIAGRTGGYATDGETASLSLDLGNGTTFDADATVAAGGTVLHAGVVDPEAPVRGMLLARNAAPTTAALAGTFLYVNAADDGSGGSTVEIGTLTLSAGGSATGVGLRTAVEIVEGTPTPGSQTPVFRSGSFSVGADGTVSILTVPNLFGDAEVWTAGTVMAADVLVGLEQDGSGGRILLRQGLGLSTADAAGDYLHFGLALGGDLALRTGVLAFDGAGAFAGDEIVTSLAGGGAPTAEAAAGTYSVASNGTATFALDGGAAGTGIVGPEARYLFTVGFGEGGLSIDFLVGLE